MSDARVILLPLLVAASTLLAGCMEAWTEPAPEPGPDAAPQGGPMSRDARVPDARAPPEFAPAEDPPTADPAEPYDFDPSLPAHLSRNTDGRLAQVDGGSAYQNGTYVRQPPPSQEEAPPCEPDGSGRPTAHPDADQDRIYDDFEAHVDALPPGARASTIVGTYCPVTWNDVLEWRELHGHFPVNSLWTSGGFAADLTREQIDAIAAREDVRVVEGNRIVGGTT